MNNENFKSYNNRYWILWILYLLLFFVIKTLNIPLLEKIQAHFYYSVFWISIIFLNLYEGSRVGNYIKKHHKEKFEELTKIPCLGPGSVNGYKALSFLYSSNNFDDENLKLLKNNYRSFIRFVITVFIGFPIFSVLGFMLE